MWTGVINFGKEEKMFNFVDSTKRKLFSKN